MKRIISTLFVYLNLFLLVFSPFPATAQRAALQSINAVQPNSFSAGINTPVTITGSNLDTVVSAKLGTTLLSNLEVLDAAHLKALVPWSLAPGTYDLTVTDAADQSATLPTAVTVSAAASGWATNGPYGGNITDPSIDPKNANRIYVSAQRSGVFWTGDGAETWQMERIAPFPGKMHFVYPTGQAMPIMYLDGGAGVNGLQRSTDNGLTWQQKMPNGYNDWATTRGIDFRAAVDDAAPDLIYLGLRSWNSVDADMGLYISTNQGDFWIRPAATAGLHVRAVALEPGQPDHVVIGTDDGKVLTSTDGGSTWSAPVQVDDPTPAPALQNIDRLVISPKLYSGQRKIWAISDGSDWVYESIDDGANWTPVQVSSGQINLDIQYHDTVSGLIWAAAGGGYYSTDDGATWTALNAQIGQIHQFALVVGAGARETATIYAGTDSGVYKSSDGGDTWAEKVQGLGAALPGAIVVSPFNADEAYAAVQGKGLLRSLDGGTHWQNTTIPNGDYRPGMAADPFTLGKFYFSYGNFQATPQVYVTTDHAASYTAYPVTLPPEFSGRQAKINALAANPATTGSLLAGVCLDYSHFPDPTEGLVYASTNGGATWTQQTTPASAMCINSLAFDPQNPQNVYAGTEGGLLISVDGGANWSVPANQPDVHRVGPVVVDPRSSLSVYLFGGPRFNNDSGGDVGTFATHDGGATWERLDGLADYPVWGLQIVPVGTQYWIYAATMNGLRFLRDIPAGAFDRYTSWEKSSGIASSATVDSFAAAADGSRVVYYIGTSGGVVPVNNSLNALRATADATQNMPGGVYRRQGAESAPVQRVVPGWKLKNTPGFGNNNNVVSALEVFNGQIYAAVSNWSSGCRIWRSPDGITWTPASEYGMSAVFGASNAAILDLVVFDGKLYASVGWGANEGQIWRSPDGTTWEKVTGNELATPIRTVLVMSVFNNALSAAAHGDGAEIWRSPTGALGSWVRVKQGGFGDPDNRAVNGLAEFNGKLYATAMNDVDGITVWCSSDGTNWVQANSAGFGDSQNTDAGGTAVLGGYLYVGVKNTAAGGQVWRFNGTQWEQVVANGFGDMNNVNIEGLFTLNDQLIGVTTNDQGLQVWRSFDGSSWSPLNVNGLGLQENNRSNWSNAFAAFQGRFLMGTWPATNNGEVWQYTGYQIYLPSLAR
jgi:photosystem II stability/assembly factor-like uncharacterized protein